ncbi:hypothetical protein B4134_1829 [Bacillus safensis]|nr:hypothetical protein B4134_1829 [Bacillus safensis]
MDTYNHLPSNQTLSHHMHDKWGGAPAFSFPSMYIRPI